ncbi:MAG TPA: hypothetical protein ENI55_04460 [Alphaproteobacteria bacterium]|nr:hypothetical protein [Alphaproteobacteria bacterium]
MTAMAAPATQRIAVIGGTVSGNRGAEAMLETIVGRIKEVLPDVKFDVFSYYPEADGRLVGDPAVTVLSARPGALVFIHLPAALWVWCWGKLGLRWPDRLLPREMAALRGSAVLLDIAGISFSDGREIFLPFNVLSIWPAMLAGVPVVKCAQAAGPFKGALNGLLAGMFLPRCRFIFGRGPETVSHLTGLGLSDRLCGGAPDLAFLHKPAYALSRENEADNQRLLERLRRAKAEGRGLVCINPSSLVHARCRKNGIDYVSILAALSRTLVSQGFAIVLLPMATRSANGDKPRNNDIAVIKSIAASLSGGVEQDFLFYADWDMNYAAIKSCMAAADCAVVSRFHGLVTALALGLPVLALGWGHKYRELLAHFGLEEWSLDSGDAAASLEKRTLALIDNGEQIRKTIAKALPDIASRAERQLEVILSILNEADLSEHTDK